VLGRFQLGDVVRVEIATPDLPDDPPVAEVVAPGGVTLRTVAMAYARDIGGFRVRLRLGSDYGVGTYTVAIGYPVAGVPQSIETSFEVVAGGDAGGPVISLYAYDRPEGRYVLAQLGGGRLVQGRNPKL
jgi:hypothetical protein